MKQIGDYELRSPLAGGSGGSAWVATPPARLGLNHAVVVNLLTPPTGRGGLKRTAELLSAAAASGAALVGLQEVALCGQRLLVVRDHDPEGVLGDLTEPREILRVLAEGARAVHTLHEAELLHLALTPWTMLHNRERVVLAEPNACWAAAPGMTVSGLPGFAAVEYTEPAFVYGTPPERASDIWSLGAILFRMLTGSSLHGRTSQRETVDGFVRQIIRMPVTILDEDLPSPVIEILRSCLAPDRQDRYPTALHLAVDLEKLLSAVDARDVLLAETLKQPLAPFQQRNGPSPSPAAPTAAEDSLAEETNGPPDPEAGDCSISEVVALGDGFAAKATDFFAQPAGPPVDGLVCGRGHVVAPHGLRCPQCGVSTVGSGRSEVTRTSLGALVFDDGSTYALVTDYVVGRGPEEDMAREGSDQPLVVLDTQRSVSRVHAEIRLRDWNVYVLDRGSANGSFLTSHGGGAWERLPAGKPALLRPGWRVAFGRRVATFVSQH